MRHLTATLIFTLALALTFVLSNCRPEKKPKQEDKDRGGGFAGVRQSMEWEMAGPELKTSLQEYIKETYPGWEIKGEMIQFENHGFYVIVMDIATEKERKSVTVTSRIFRRADSSYYWKCEPFTPEIKALQELVDSKSKDRPPSQSN